MKREIYQKLYEDPNLHYGNSAKNRCPGTRSFPLYRYYLMSPIIDIGCGRGDTVELLRKEGYTAEGVDQIDLDNQMHVKDIVDFPCDDYKTALCVDVFEHINDEEVEAVLNNMKATRRQIIQIHCGPSKENGYGEELHINQKSPNDWRDIINQKLKIQLMYKASPNRIIFFCGDDPVSVEKFEIPPKFKMRCFWNDDGSFWIPRHNRELEAYLNRYCIKIADRTYYPPIHAGKHIDELKDKYKGQTAYIIGKGPSLDHIRKYVFEQPGPIFCINDSIHHVVAANHDMYCFQSDTNLGEECLPKDPSTTLILHQRLQHFYTDYENKYYYHQRQLHPTLSGPTAAIAVCFAKFMGCKHIVMLCLDACVTKNTAYADCVGYENTRFGLKPDRFLNHRQRIDKFLNGISHEWVIPTDQSSHELASSDIPQQLSNNPEEHHEHLDNQHQASLTTTITSPLKTEQVHQKTIVDHLDIGQTS